MTPRSAWAGTISIIGTSSGNASIASMTFNAASNLHSANRAKATDLRIIAFVFASQPMPLAIPSSSEANIAASGTRLSLTLNDQTRPAVAIASDV